MSSFGFHPTQIRMTPMLVILPLHLDLSSSLSAVNGLYIIPNPPYLLVFFDTRLVELAAVLYRTLAFVYPQEPYLIVAIVPFFLSTARGARAMGLTLAAALIAAAGVPATARTTVWCLFTLLLSGQIVRAEWRQRRGANLRAVRTSAIDVTC